MNRLFSRRNVLRGAGVALTLPWLESLTPKAAHAADVVRKRYLPIYLPNGASEFWKPTSSGVGSVWTLSSVLSPLASLKSKVVVLSNLENGTAFYEDRRAEVEPSHGRQPGAWLTCMDPEPIRKQLKVEEANIPSVDQRIAKFLKAQGALPIDSMQLGLSTAFSYCDGQPCGNSRSVSWDATNLPMFKLVDPLEVFNKLVAVTTPTTDDDMPDPALAKRLALNKSVLDAVKANTDATKLRLGSQDRQRLDEFLTAVREVEVRATQASGGLGGVACNPITKPTLSSASNPIFNNDYARQNGPTPNGLTYNKGTHADVMNDLIVMAFQCDATRVISYMLEDERSEFNYDHVPRRTFTAASSEPMTGMCGQYHGAQHDDPNGYATISWWNVSKVAELCQKLDKLQEADGKTVLDNTLVMLGSAMHGSNHSCDELPTVLIGSGGGAFKTDQHVLLGKRWIRDLHHTVMTRMYGMSGADVESFGAVRGNVPRAEISEILA